MDCKRIRYCRHMQPCIRIYYLLSREYRVYTRVLRVVEVDEVHVEGTLLTILKVL